MTKDPATGSFGLRLEETGKAKPVVKGVEDSDLTVAGAPGIPRDELLFVKSLVIASHLKVAKLLAFAVLAEPSLTSISAKLLDFMQFWWLGNSWYILHSNFVNSIGDILFCALPTSVTAIVIVNYVIATNLDRVRLCLKADKTSTYIADFDVTLLARLRVILSTLDGGILRLAIPVAKHAGSVSDPHPVTHCSLRHHGGKSLGSLKIHAMLLAGCGQTGEVSSPKVFGNKLQSLVLRK